jgi:hypothetical protein
VDGSGLVKNLVLLKVDILKVLFIKKEKKLKRKV